MKKMIKYWAFAIVAMFMITACSEEAGLDDGMKVKGMVSYTDGAAAGATVYIAYGATAATTDFDQVTVADANGNYHFDGLNKGDYYIDAVYTNDQNIEFNTPGTLVTIGGEGDEVTVNFVLK